MCEMIDFSLLLSIFTSVAGSVGFAMVWNMENKYIPYAALIAFCTRTCELVFDRLTGGTFLPALIATFAAVLVAEVMARITKTTAAQFRISGIVCLIPGSGLYNTMNCLIRSDTVGVHSYATATAHGVLGIAGGICLGSAMLYMLRVILDKDRDDFAY